MAAKKLDGMGSPIPTYDQATIEAFAHVFTGWNYTGFVNFQNAYQTAMNQVLPMKLYPEFHDDGEKVLLGGTVLPAGQGGVQDLEAALDNIFNHLNVGPFTRHSPDPATRDKYSVAGLCAARRQRI